MNEGIIGAP